MKKRRELPITALPGRSSLDQKRSSERFAFEILKDPETRAALQKRVRHLMEQVIDLNIQTVIFLDKSARPISWLFRAMWRQENPGQPIPHILFSSIGRTDPHRQHPRLERLLELTNEFILLEPPGKQFMNAEDHPPGEIRREPTARDALVEYITQERGYTRGGFQKHVDTVRNLYDPYWKSTMSHQGSGPVNAVVVDEYSQRGATQQLASLLLEKAFPTMRVYSTNLFSSGETEHLPWLQEQGMTGVVELADDQLLAHPANEEYLTKLRDELSKAYAREIQSIKESIDRQIPSGEWDAIDEMLAFVSTRPNSELNRANILQYYARIKPFFELCRAFRTQEDRPISKQLNDLEKLDEASTKAKHDFSELTKTDPSIDWFWVPALHLFPPRLPLHDATRAGWLLQKLDDIPSLLRSAKQLRKEMGQLANE